MAEQGAPRAGTDPRQSIFTGHGDESQPESLRTMSEGGTSMPRTEAPAGSLHRWVLSGSGATPPPDGTVPMVQRGESPDGGDEARPAYELLAMVGRGGMGEVYEAVQTSLGRIVAVKRLARHFTEGTAGTLAGASAAFRTEAVIAGALEHPNILPVHDLGVDESRLPLLAMKLVEGASWDRLLHADFEAGLAADELLARHLPTLVGMAQAVAFAHSRGIVHRDLKPAQVLVGAYGEVLLTDWGLAIHAPASGGEGGSGRRRLPRWIPTRDSASSPSGTPALMAPEQTAPTAIGVGPWSDVYALGGTLYFLLTGSYPHESATAAGALERARAGVVEPPAARAPGRANPPELEALAMECLQADVGKRLPSAREFVVRLTDYLTGSSRRAESIALTAEMRAAPANADYRALGDRIARLDRAIMLWPANAEAAELREAALGEFARAALAHADLTLARAMANRMAPGMGRSELHAAADRAAAALRRQARTRRLATAAAAALLCVVVVGGALSHHQIRQERDAAREARALADTRRAEAEANLAIAGEQGRGANDLVLFVLDELKSQLDSQLTAERGLTVDAANEVSHAIAGGVAGRMLGYYRSLDARAWPVELRRQHLYRILDATDRVSELSRIDEAVELTSMALELARGIAPGDSPEMLAAEARAAENLRDAGLNAEALDAWSAVLAAMERTGAAPAERASVLVSIAESLSSLGRWDEAFEALDRGAALVAGPDPGLARVRAEVLAMLGRVQGRRGAMKESVAAQREALAILDSLPGPRQDNRWLLASELASSLAATGQFEEALALADEALAWREKQSGPNNPQTANALNVKAAILSRMDRPADALPLMERALGIMEKSLGPEHPGTIAVMGNVATIRSNLGRSAEAIPAFEHVLAWRRANLGGDHPATATTMVSLAAAQADVGRLDEALALFREGLAVREAKLDPRSPQLLDARLHLLAHLGRMGTLAHQAGRSEEAKASAEEFLAALAGHEEAIFGKQPARRLDKAAATFHAGRKDDAARMVREIIESGAYESWGSEAQKVLANVARLVGVEPPVEQPPQ